MSPCTGVGITGVLCRDRRPRAQRGNVPLIVAQTQDGVGRETNADSDQSPPHQVECVIAADRCGQVQGLRYSEDDRTGSRDGPAPPEGDRQHDPPAEMAGDKDDSQYDDGGFVCRRIYGSDNCVVRGPG